MKLTINVNYNHLEFEPEEIEALKTFITNQLKDGDRQMGTGFLFKGLSFIIQAIYFNVETVEKIISIQQVNTKKNPIIETPKLVKIN